MRRALQEIWTLNRSKQWLVQNWKAEFGPIFHSTGPSGSDAKASL